MQVFMFFYECSYKMLTIGCVCSIIYGDVKYPTAGFFHSGAVKPYSCLIGSMCRNCPEMTEKVIFTERRRK